jgi:hypothetical protein
MVFRGVAAKAIPCGLPDEPADSFVREDFLEKLFPSGALGGVVEVPAETNLVISCSRECSVIIPVLRSTTPLRAYEPGVGVKLLWANNYSSVIARCC